MKEINIESYQDVLNGGMNYYLWKEVNLVLYDRFSGTTYMLNKISNTWDVHEKINEIFYGGHLSDICPISETDAANIRTALLIAANAHKGQVDKGGKAYINHPIAVSNLVHLPYPDNSSELVNNQIVALLHDTVEDTDITLDDLKKIGFCDAVIQTVAAVTHRKDETYDEYMNRLEGNEIACCVKLADLKHNSDLSRLPGEPTEKDFERKEKYGKYINQLSKKIDQYNPCPYKSIGLEEDAPSVTIEVEPWESEENRSKYHGEGKIPYLQMVKKAIKEKDDFYLECSGFDEFNALLSDPADNDTTSKADLLDRAFANLKENNTNNAFECVEKLFQMHTDYSDFSKIIQGKIDDYSDLADTEQYRSLIYKILNDSCYYGSICFCLKLIEKLNDLPDDMCPILSDLAYISSLSKESIALIKRNQKGNDIIFEISKKANTLARSYAVIALNPSTPEIREWMLYDGVRDGDDFELLAIFWKLGIHKMIENDNLSKKELTAIGRIIFAPVEYEGEALLLYYDNIYKLSDQPIKRLRRREWNDLAEKYLKKAADINVQQINSILHWFLIAAGNEYNQKIMDEISDYLNDRINTDPLESLPRENWNAWL